MSYGRIRRGPMASDAFTQIRNALFRDPRLSLKDKGLFGLISTHRDGWGVTPESLSTCCTDGVSAIKSGLRNLERYGYLKRDRERRKNGTLGSSAYFITDQPDALLELVEEEVRRSEPKVDYPPVDEPPEAEPTVDDRPHKKTNSKQTNPKKTPSPSVPHDIPSSEAEPASGGEGGDAPQQEEQDGQAAAFVDSLPYRGRLPGPRQRTHLINRVVEALAAGWAESALRRQLTEETDNAKSMAAVYRHRLDPENLPPAPAVPSPRNSPEQPVSRPRCPECHRPLANAVEDALCRDCREDASA